jgi:WD40 repeat protein
MIIVLEIGLLIAGLVALFTGKFRLSKHRVAVGAAARIAGALLLLPWPTAFAVGWLLSLELRSQGQRFDPQEWQMTLIGLELGIIAACALLSFGIAFATARAPEPDRSRVRKDELAPAGTDEPAWVLPANPASAEIQDRPPPPRLRTSTREPERRQSIASASRVAASRSAGDVSWVLGGLAAILILLMICSGGGVLLFWMALVRGRHPAPGPGPVVVLPDQGPGAQPPAVGPDRDWPNNPPQRLPGDWPGGLPDMGPGGPPQIAPPPPAPPAPPEKKEPLGLRATMDLGSTLTALALAPDGATLATASTDQTVTLWDTATATARKPLPGNESDIHHLLYSPDGRWLASADTGPFVKLREAATGRQHASFHIGDNQHSYDLAFSPDGKTLLVVAGGVVKLFEVETGKGRDFLHGNPDARETNLGRGSFTADGRQLFLAGIRNNRGALERTEAIWDVASGQREDELKAFPGQDFLGKCMTPDGHHVLYYQLANVVVNDPAIHVWDRTTGRETTRLEGSASLTATAFSPDGRSLIAGYGDGTVGLWDYKAGKRLAQFTANWPDEGLQAVLNDPTWGEPHKVRGVALSADGKLLVTGKTNGFKLWDAEKVFGRSLAAVAPQKPPVPGPAGIRELAALRIPDKNLIGLAISPDGKVLAASTAKPPPGEGPGRLTLWDLATRKEIDHATRSVGLCFTPDGRSLLCALQQNAWDVAAAALNGDDPLSPELGLRDAQTLQMHPGSVRCLTWAFSPDGRTLLTAGRTPNGPELRVHEAATLKELAVWKQPRNGDIGALAFAPDGRSFAAALSSKPDVHICDAGTGESRLTCTGHTGEVHAIAWAADGKRFATGGADRTVRLWDAGAGKALAVLEGHSADVRRLAYAPDARLLVSGGDDAVRLWDTGKEKELATLEPAGSGPVVMALAPAGKLLAVGRGDAVRLWDVGAVVGPPVPRPRPRVTVHPAPPPPGPELTPRQITLDEGVRGLAFAPDGRRAVTATGFKKIRVWDLVDGKELRSFEVPRPGRLTVCPDGRHLINAGGYQGEGMRLYDLETGQEVRCFCQDDVDNPALSPDGRQVLATDIEGFRLWDVATGKELRRFSGEAKPCSAVAFSPDGALAASGSGAVVRLWDVATGQQIGALEGHTAHVLGVAFSPDGKWLLSSSNDGTLRLWDVEAGKQVRCFGSGKFDSLTRNVGFFPDGKRALSADGKALHLWDVATGQEVPSAVQGWGAHRDLVVAVVLSPDGRYALSGGLDQRLILWRLPTDKAP